MLYLVFFFNMAGKHFYVTKQRLQCIRNDITSFQSLKSSLMSLYMASPSCTLYHPWRGIYNMRYICYLDIYYKLMYLMMFLHPINLSQSIIRYPKDEYQVVVYLFMLILVILWSIIHSYCRFYHYDPYNNGSFMLFFYLIDVYDLLLYTLMILKQSILSIDISSILPIAGAQLLPAALCAYLASVLYQLYAYKYICILLLKTCKNGICLINVRNLLLDTRNCRQC